MQRIVPHSLLVWEDTHQKAKHSEFLPSWRLRRQTVRVVGGGSFMGRVGLLVSSKDREEARGVAMQIDVGKIRRV